MARIIAIDYGTKRTGIATTDPLQIIATALDTVPTHTLWDYLTQYLGREDVDAIVLGKPTHRDGTDTPLNTAILGLSRKIAKQYPLICIHYQDEAYSSVEAAEVILASGIGKKKRRDRSLVDKISAVIILQRFLGHY